MNDQLSVLALVTTRLDATGIGYMVTGSIAAGHYARPRMARDIDVVAAPQPGGHPMWMVSAEDLVLSKLLWSKEMRSELQMRDVRQLIAARPDLDWIYVEMWAS